MTMTRAVNLTLRTAEYIGAFGLIGVIVYVVVMFSRITYMCLAYPV